MKDNGAVARFGEAECCKHQKSDHLSRNLEALESYLLEHFLTDISSK